MNFKKEILKISELQDIANEMTSTSGVAATKEPLEVDEDCGCKDHKNEGCDDLENEVLTIEEEINSLIEKIEKEWQKEN